MFILSLLLTLLLLVAFSLLWVPSSGKLFSTRRVTLSLLITLFSLSLYLLFSNPFALNGWLNHGQQHYQLLMDYENLGGIDGIITKIKQKLAKNSDDLQGWMILGKLYESKQDFYRAKKAFDKARQ